MSLIVHKLETRCCKIILMYKSQYCIVFVILKRSAEESCDLLSQKASIVEEEAQLLRQQATEAQQQIEAVRQELVSVCSNFCMYNFCMYP